MSISIPFFSEITLICILLLNLCFIPACPAQELDLTQLSLEELMNLEVQVASKTSKNLFETAAAAYVISQEAIQHSGFTNVPDLLRLAPGFAVARIDGNKWAISSRGFNGVFANKLLVLIDGRTVYSHLFSGVFWNYQELLLEDISQIEIVRGPGATLWGSNAVNGIVNILTKPASETQGGMLSVIAGTEEQLITSFRYGGNYKNEVFYRFDGKYTKRNHLEDSSGTAASDAWQGQRAAFRVDWYPQSRSQITLQGDYYTDEVGQMVSIIPSETQPFYQQIDSVATDEGGNILLRLNHQFSVDNEITLQFYYDQFIRHDIIMNGIVETFDYEINHRFKIGAAQEIVWGLGWRDLFDESDGTFYFSVTPENQKSSIFNAFLQDEIHFFRDRLQLILGSKFEHHDYTGLEIQPNIRLLYRPGHNYACWFAASRAVRTPSRVERDVTTIRGVQYVRGIPVFGILKGSHDYESEILHAWELGFRTRLNSIMNIDLALFYNHYDNLRNYEQGEWEYKFTPPPAHGLAYFYMDNNMKGRSYGGELLLNLKPASWCQFEASYSNVKIKADVELTNLFSEFAKGIEGETPEHQVSLHGVFTLAYSLNLDFGFRFIDRVPTLNLDHYFNLDAQLSWQVNQNLKLSIVGQNLLEKRHTEYLPAYDDILATQIPRGFFARMQLKF